MSETCEVCGRQKHMIYRGERWCCDDCRKVVTGELQPTTAQWNTMSDTLLMELGGRRCD